MAYMNPRSFRELGWAVSMFLEVRSFVEHLDATLEPQEFEWKSPDGEKVQTIECSWREKPVLRRKAIRVKTGNLVPKKDDDGKVVLDANGAVVMVDEWEIVGWAVKLVKVSLPFLDLARKIKGMKPGQFINLNERDCASILERLFVHMLPTLADEAEEERQTSIRTRRLENLVKARQVRSMKADLVEDALAFLRSDPSFTRRMEARWGHSERTKTLRGGRNTSTN